MAHSYEDIIYALSELQSQELSIIRLSEPISATNAPDAPKRTSDVSSDAFENPSPASLAADLGHYKVFTFPNAFRLDKESDQIQRSSSRSSASPTLSK